MPYPAHELALTSRPPSRVPESNLQITGATYGMPVWTLSTGIIRNVVRVALRQQQKPIRRKLLVRLLA